MDRFKNQNWNDIGNLSLWQLVPIVLLVDAHDEPQNAIAKNTNKPTRKKKVQK